MSPLSMLSESPRPWHPVEVLHVVRRNLPACLTQNALVKTPKTCPPVGVQEEDHR